MTSKTIIRYMLLLAVVLGNQLLCAAVEDDLAQISSAESTSHSREFLERHKTSSENLRRVEKVITKARETHNPDLVQLIAQWFAAVDWTQTESYAFDTKVASLMDALNAENHPMRRKFYTYFKRVPEFKYEGKGPWDARYVYRGLQGILAKGIIESEDKASIDTLLKMLEAPDVNVDTKRTILFVQQYRRDYESAERFLAQFIDRARDSDLRQEASSSLTYLKNRISEKKESK